MVLTALKIIRYLGDKMKLIKSSTIYGFNIFVTSNEDVFIKIVPKQQEFGYKGIHIGKINTRLHVLMCTAYHGERPSKKHVVRHLDGNPSNNKKENLIWGLQKENCEDTVRHGNSTRGSKNARSVLKEKDVKKIKRMLGKIPSRIIANNFGVSEQTICDIRKGRQWGWLK